MHESTCWWLPPGTLHVQRRPAIHVVVMFTEQSDWEQAARGLLTCCETENFRLNVTLSVLIDSTLVSPEITEGGQDCNLLLLGLTKTISADLARFNCRLLLHAQLLMLPSSSGQEWMLLAGKGKYVSSAYFNMKFVWETGWRSEAVMISWRLMLYDRADDRMWKQKLWREYITNTRLAFSPLMNTRSKMSQL